MKTGLVLSSRDARLVLIIALAVGFLSCSEESSTCPDGPLPLGVTPPAPAARLTNSR